MMLKSAGLPVARGTIARTPEEAEIAARVFFDLVGPGDIVMKAQVLAGGRGKGRFTSGLQGGVQMANSPEKVKTFAEKMLGHKLITKQTGEAGKPCNVLYMVERVPVAKETYLAFLLDRDSNGPVMIASAEGGMDIEAVAHATPEKIHRTLIEPQVGLTEKDSLSVAEKLGFKSPQKEEAARQFRVLWELFWKNDATMVEINPFAMLGGGQVMCLDAKFNLDTNALFRHPEFTLLKDESQEDPRDVQAHKHDINYIGLNGSIGCLVNGAGLAMATMDLIKLSGGEPANFLDIGGGASETQVTEAFKLLNADPQVKAILVNIFGGIMRCDVIAAGIVKACKSLRLDTPVVVRLQGTNFAEGKRIIDESGLRLVVDDNLEHAAAQAVRLAKIATLADEAHVKVQFEFPL
jgi:succinyl-CoA synthetase beta subunit